MCKKDLVVSSLYSFIFQLTEYQFNNTHDIFLLDIPPIFLEQQEGHDGPVLLHWLIREIYSYQTLHYLGIGLKHKTPDKD